MGLLLLGVLVLLALAIGWGLACFVASDVEPVHSVKPASHVRLLEDEAA